MAMLINVGNTHTQVAASKAAHLEGAVRQFDTESLRGPVLPGALLDALSRPCLIASVVPAVTQRLKDAAADFFRPPLFLAPGMINEVDLSQVDSSTLGADRIANAVAATTGCLPVIVLDCGTCITTETIDASRRFRGGAILPGRRLLRQALVDHTGQLPWVPLSDVCPQTLGTSTREAILAGVDVGVLGSVARLLRETRRELGVESCTVVAVGGDAAFFCRHLVGLDAGGGDFTLRGIALVASRLFEARSPA